MANQNNGVRLGVETTIGALTSIEVASPLLNILTEVEGDQRGGNDGKGVVGSLHREHESDSNKMSSDRTDLLREELEAAGLLNLLLQSRLDGGSLGGDLLELGEDLEGSSSRLEVTYHEGESQCLGQKEKRRIEYQQHPWRHHRDQCSCRTSSQHKQQYRQCWRPSCQCERRPREHCYERTYQKKIR